MLDLKKPVKVTFIIALELVFCFTPLGSIPIGPIVATLSMVPVIIASLVYGKKVGMLLGMVFAICSFIYWTFILPAYPTAFLFTPFAEAAGYKGNFGSLIICFVPRIISGAVPAMVLDIPKSKNSIGISALASALGSLTNTFFVLIFISVFFGKEYSTIMGQGIFTILGLTILTNGIPEAIICSIVCPVIAKVIKSI